MSGSALDARLLRFRHNPSAEDPSILAAALLDESRAYHALEVLTTGLETGAEDVELLLLGGRAWLIEGDLLRAQNALLQAARVAPNDPRPFRWLSEVLIARGDPARAKRVLEHALELTPKDPEIVALRERADAVIDQSEVTIESFESFEDEVPEFEDDGEPTSGPRAIEFGALRVAEPRDWTWLWRTLFWTSCALACGAFGYALWSWLGTPEPAPSIEIAEAIEVVPSPPPPSAPKVVIPEEVVVAAKPAPAPIAFVGPPAPQPFVGPPAPEPAAAAVDPQAAMRRVARLNARAQRLVRAGRHELTISIATKALEAASALPNTEAAQAESLYLIGRAHLEQRRRESAGVYLSRAVEFGEAPAEAWFYLGESLAAVNSPAARAAYERYLSLRPESRLAIRARKAIN